jgi:hypothetical protein
MEQVKIGILQSHKKFVRVLIEGVLPWAVTG